MIWADAPCWSTCWNGGNIYEEALRHESIEFVLVQHPWMENDTVFADIILPVKTVFECSDITTDSLGGQFPLYYVEDVAIDSVGEARSDAEIVADVAGALERFGGKYEGLRDKFVRGMTHEETIRKGFDESGPPEGFTWEDLMEKKFWAGPINPDWENTPAGLKLFNERGSVLGGVRITERIMPGALYQDHGARIDSIVAGTGGLDRGGANNLICPNATTSKNAGGEVTNSFLVGIEKVDVAALAEQYPEQFGRDYDEVNGLLATAYIEE